MFLQSVPYPAVAAESVPPSQVGAATYATNGTLPQNPSLAYPSGVAAGRIAVIHVVSVDSTNLNAINTPSGFTEKIQDGTNNDPTTAIYWRRLDGSEVGPVTITLAGGIGSTDSVGASMTLWQDCIQSGDPFEAVTTYDSPSNTTAMSCGAVSTTGPQRLIMHFGSVVNQCSCTPVSGYSQVYAVADGTGIPEITSILNTKTRALKGVETGVEHTLSASLGFKTFATALLPVPVLPIFTSNPSIASDTGFYGTGDTLIATLGVHDAVIETYEWLRDGVAIGGATTTSYTLTGADVGTVIRFRHTATNSVGSTSRTTAPTPTIVTPTWSSVNRTLSDTTDRTLSDTTTRTYSDRIA